jgi:cellulose synthase/poly-beta-1,6-N-acetylglucosamine synthase-like glycosyltransferase
MAWVLAALYTTACALLVLYGLYRVVLLGAWLRASRRPAVPAPAAPAAWPTVTVQLPLYNERFVARRLLEAVAALDYPPGRLEIQVLDDSTDGCSRLVRRVAAVLRRRGLDVQVLPRSTRRGYKAGALAAGLQRARGDVLAVFDADFVPPPDFLRRTVPHLLQDGTGIVQARWGHLNRDASWFTRLQAILLDGHFVIEQTARASTGCLLSFNGTCAVLRRAAVAAAGGWQSDTVTEDLDLGLRAQLAGWRIVYLADLVVPGEIPTDAAAFRAQQRRWTRGGVQVARKLLPRLLGSPLAWWQKLEACLHLTCYAAFPLLLLLALLRTPARMFALAPSFLGVLPGEIELLCCGTLPLVAFYAATQTRARRGGAYLHSLAAMALGAGLAVSNTRAVLEGLFGSDLRFERTPKLGTRRRQAACPHYRAPASTIAVLEIGMVVYLLLWKLLGTGPAVVTDIPFLAFFASGLLALPLQRRPDPAP